MNIVQLLQGSQEWLDFRAKRLTASEAPAMMGESKYQTRDALLHQKATGEVPEVTPEQQRVFDRGHAIEAQARPFGEKIIGEELFPCTIEDDEQRLAASMDGLTMLGDVGWECKSSNAELRKVDRAEDLADHYKWQMDQQMLLSGAKRILFTASDGTEEGSIHLWYERDEDRIKKLIAGWVQFEKDLADYQPAERTEKAQAEATEAFPTLYLEIHGDVDNSNLPAFVDRATQYIKAINTDLQTDQDFANAEQAVKDLEKAEKQIEIVKSQALAQTTSIEEAFKEMDRIRESCRTKRLALAKLVKSEKENRKNAIIREAQDALQSEIGKANDEFRPVCITGITADFHGAAKGKRNLDSIQSACNDELARARIELNEKRDHIRRSLKIIEDQAGDYQNLFHDRQQLVDLDHDHLELVVKQRVDEHKAVEQKRIEAEAQRIAEQKRQQEEREQAAKQQATDAPEKPQEQREVGPTNDAGNKPAPAPGASQPARKERPSDQEIIEVLALHFRVHESKVVAWLLDMDLNQASEKMASNM